MKIQVFASLKDFFEKEFELKEGISDVASLQSHLQTVAPSAANILARCRYAVQEEFVDKNYLLHENDTVFIIPPSSGG